jgi:hypothetical protein
MGGMFRAAARLMLVTLMFFTVALGCICVLVDMLMDGAIRMDMHVDVRLGGSRCDLLDDLVEAIGRHRPIGHGKRDPGTDDAREIGQRHQAREAPAEPSHADSNHRLALTRFVMRSKLATPDALRQPATPRYWWTYCDTVDNATAAGSNDRREPKSNAYGPFRTPAASWRRGPFLRYADVRSNWSEQQPVQSVLTGNHGWPSGPRRR